MTWPGSAENDQKKYYGTLARDSNFLIFAVNYRRDVIRFIITCYVIPILRKTLMRYILFGFVDADLFPLIIHGKVGRGQLSILGSYRNLKATKVTY